MMSETRHLELEYTALLEEYRSLREEINATLDSSRQVVNLTLVGVGGLIAFFPFLLQLQSQTVFLLIPFFFYGLAWTQLRYILLAQRIGSYLDKNVISRIRSILKTVANGEEDDYGSFMSWESGRGTNLILQVGFSVVLIEGAGFAIPLLAGLLSLVVFVIISRQSSYVLNWIDILLMIINIGALLYSAYWGFRLALGRTK